MKIVSGGQTGVNGAALDAAPQAGYPCGGWAPGDRMAKNGGDIGSIPADGVRASGGL
jgi:hypothetical protein